MNILSRELFIFGSLTPDVETLRNRLFRALDGLELLLMAWARYEDELPPGELKQTASKARRDWGTIAAEFLKSE